MGSINKLLRKDSCQHVVEGLPIVKLPSLLRKNTLCVSKYLSNQ